MLPEIDETIEVDYVEAELRYAAGLVEDGQATWQNLMETVVSDRLDEDEEPTIEVGYGPSPMNFIIQQDSPLLEVLRQFPQHYRRDREVDWGNIPIITEDAIIGVDPAAVESGEVAITEMYRGHIIIAFGIPKEALEAARATAKSQLEKEMLHFINVALCTPSRHPITGVA